MNQETIQSLQVALKDLEIQKSRLSEQLKTIQLDIDALTRMVMRYRGQASLTLDVSSEALPKDGSGEQPNFKDVVLSVLRVAFPQSLKAREVQERAVNMGFKPKALNFDNATFAMLSLLLKKKKIEKTGSGLYRAKP